MLSDSNWRNPGEARTETMDGAATAPTPASGQATPPAAIGAPGVTDSAKPPMLRRTRTVIVGFVGSSLLLLAALDLARALVPGMPQRHSAYRLVHAHDAQDVVLGIALVFGAGFMGLIASACGQTLRRLGQQRFGRFMAVSGLGLAVTGVAASFSLSGAQASPRPGEIPMTDHDRQVAKSIADFGQKVIANKDTNLNAVRNAKLAGVQDMSPTEKALAHYMEALARQGANQRQALQSLNLVSWLRPENLASPATRLDTRSKLQRARELDRAHVDKCREISRTFVQEVTEAGGTEPERRQLQREASEAMAEFEKTLSATYRYDMAIFDETEVLLKLLDSQGTSVRLHLGQLQFEDPQAMAIYRGSVQRLVSLSAKEEAIMRATTERSKEITESMKNAARTGDFSGVQAVTEPPARPMPKITVDAAGIKVNGRPLANPIKFEAMNGVLGPVERRDVSGPDMRVWDSIGTFAFVLPKTDTVVSIAVSLNDSTLAEPGKTKDYTGEFEVLGQAISDVDTPASVNKRLPAATQFVSNDQNDGEWDLRLDQCEVRLFMGNSGMLETIVIVPQMKFEDDSPRKIKF